MKNKANLCVCVYVDKDIDKRMKSKGFCSWAFFVLGVGESKLLKILCDQAYIYQWNEYLLLCYSRLPKAISQ